MTHLTRTGFVALLLTSAAFGSAAANSAAPTRDSDDVASQAGVLVICGGGALGDDLRQEFTSRVPEEKTVVLLVLASSKPADSANGCRAWLQSAGVTQISAPELDEQGNSLPLEQLEQVVSAAIAESAAVWIGGGQQSRLAERYAVTRVEDELIRLLQRGGVIGGTSAGAAIMSQVMIAGGRERPVMGTGFNLLRSAIIDQHFSERGRITRSRVAISEHPRCFGLGIDESTGAIVHGTTVRVCGAGTVTVVTVPRQGEAPVEMIYADGHRFDLTSLQVRQPQDDVTSQNTVRDRK